MLIRADVKCYFCGHVSGQIEGDPTEGHVTWIFRQAGEANGPTSEPRARLRCDRCRGPVFLDDVETVRAHPPVGSSLTAAQR